MIDYKSKHYRFYRYFRRLGFIFTAKDNNKYEFIDYDGEMFVCSNDHISEAGIFTIKNVEDGTILKFTKDELFDFIN